MGQRQLELYMVLPEHVALLDGATRACRHISEKLMEGDPLKHRVDKDISPGPGADVALCNECRAYVMSQTVKK